MCDNTSEGNSTTGWQSEAEPTSKTMAVNSYAFSINASTTTLLSIPWDNKGKTNKPLPVRKYFFFYFRKESFLCSYSNCPSFKRKDTSRISSVAFLIESFTPKATLTPMLDPELAGFTCNKMKWSKRDIKKKEGKWTFSTSRPKKLPDAYHDFSNLEVQLIIRKPLRYFTFVYFSSLSELLMLILNMRRISPRTHRIFQSRTW